MKPFMEFVIKPKRNISNPLSLTVSNFFTTAFHELPEGSSESSKSNKSSSNTTLESKDEMHVAGVMKLLNLNDTVLNRDCTKKQQAEPNFRKNELNIQMLSANLHRQIFGVNNDSVMKSQKIKNCIDEMKQNGFGKKSNDILKDVNLDLPPLKGKNIEEHFYNIGKEQSECYKQLVQQLIKNDIPEPPSVWLKQKGWTMYVPGQEPVSVNYPDEDCLVFDVEVCVKMGESPTLATAFSKNAWYGWVSHDLFDGIDAPPNYFYTTNNLIPCDDGQLSLKDKPRLFIGHNISYDRARIREEYSIANNAARFLDTMALHVCISGITRTQKTLLKRDNDGILEGISGYMCLSSLKDVYQFYCQKELNKEKKKGFVEGSLADVRNDFQSFMQYCANDVKATFEVLKTIFPTFLERFPHPVTLAGMLELSTAFLTVTENWKKFLIEAEQTYEDLNNEMNMLLSKKTDHACRMHHNEKYKNDLWMWNEDWSVQAFKLPKSSSHGKNTLENIIEISGGSEESKLEVGENALNEKFQFLFEQRLPKTKPLLPGYPLWYRKLYQKTDQNVQPTAAMVITPKLLQLTWEKFPVYHTRDHGWGIIVADLKAENVDTSLPFEKLKDLTMKNCGMNSDGFRHIFGESIAEMKRRRKKLKPPEYYVGAGVWCNHTIDDCCYFFKLPHKDGNDKNVGNPLSKDFTSVFFKNLSGSDRTAEKVIDLGQKLSYWRNNKDRVFSQMVVWLNKKESLAQGQDEHAPVGVILPKVIVSGTLTRRALESTWLTASRATTNRIGSELRCLIEAPAGYHIVGADVDSEELWIAALISDAGKLHGSTPFSWMTLSGTKANETDMHSVTAKAVGISRDHAKTINYARIYGAGVGFAQKLLLQFNPSIGEDEAMAKARKMFALTKGTRMYKVKASFEKEFLRQFGRLKVCDANTAAKYSKIMGKELFDVFEKFEWVGGTESVMFNRLEGIAKSLQPTTPFLSCRLSQVLEPKYEGDNRNMNTRINWVVQSGAVDFLHLMLVCMRWLTNGQARYCFSFHDEIRYLVPSDKRYDCALAVHITNLLVRSFCSHRLGIYDLPQSVAFFSSVEVDKVLRKEANDDCVTPSNPHGMEKGYGVAPGESLDIYQTILKSGGNLSAFAEKKMSKATKRKHVRREALEEELRLPEGNQQIVRVLGSKGNNLHEVLSADQSTFLVSMPNKFRKNIWIKKGDYILVEPIEEGEKVKAEMVKVLRSDHIKFLKSENAWPREFFENEKSVVDADENFDNYLVNSNQNIETDTDSSFSSSSSEDCD